MKKALVICAIAIFIIGGFILIQKLKIRNASHASTIITTNTAVVATNAPPIIHILRGKAYRTDDTGKRGKELHNGAPLTIIPITIKVISGGLANINFPDGSMARIDGGTTFTIEKSGYDAMTGKSNTSIFLTIGKIWSKVVELATLDSSWEVQTSNAVATVRGTAFNSIVKGKKAMFTGSENTVAIMPIDPKTHERLQDQEVLVTRDEEVEISSDQLDDIASHKQKMIIETHKADIAVDEWINQNEDEDTTVNEAMHDLKTEMKDQLLDGDRIPANLRDELRLYIKKRLNDFYEAHQKEMNIENIDVPPLEPSTDVVSFDVTLISPDPLPDPVLEGTRIVAQAMLEFSDGTVEDITKEGEWNVLGPIGYMISPGIFMAELDSSVSKFGESSGAITVTFIDPITNESYFVKTPIFKVATALPTTVTTPTIL